MFIMNCIGPVGFLEMQKQMFLVFIYEPLFFVVVVYLPSTDAMAH